MKKIRKSLSLFLSLIMAFSVFSMIGATSFTAYAYGEIYTSGPYTYNLYSDYIVSIEKVQPVDGNINIVSSIDGHRITIYQNYAFDECREVAESITFEDFEALQLTVGVYPFEFVEFEKLNTAYMNFSWVQSLITDVEESQYDSFDFGTLFDSEEDLNSFVDGIKGEFLYFEFGALKGCRVVFQENDFLVTKPDGKIYTNGNHKFWQDVYAKFDIAEDIVINPLPRIVSGPYTYVDYYGCAVIMDIEPVDGVVVIPDKIDGKYAYICEYTEFGKCADAKKLVYSSFESASRIAESVVNYSDINLEMHLVTTVELLFKLEDVYEAELGMELEEIVDGYENIDEFISDVKSYFGFFIDECDLTNVHNLILQDGDIFKSNEDGSVSTDNSNHFWDALYEKFGITDDIVVYDPPMKGHLNEGTYAYSDSATCESEGLIEILYDCGEPCTSYIGKLEHSYTGEVRNNGGTHSRKCVNGCGQYGEEVMCTYVELETITTPCKIIRTSYCTGCYCTMIEEFPYGHQLHFEEVVAPTCTKNGYTVYTCSVCHDKCYDSYVKKLDHSYTGSARSNEDGTHSRKCVNGCDKYGDAVECTYGDWVTVPATCTTDGERSRTCTACGYTETQVIPQGHKYVEEVVAPTCTKDGYTVHTCSVCQDKYTDSVVEKTGHIDENGDSVCDNCKESLKTDSGNNSSENVIDRLIALVKRIINWFKSLFSKK